ncbi:hypothetical protein BOTBODRAFT_37576 [Botryobasidium botryosum FD-172 SS1]|uniref:RlpA-like protein double-psi beta-barrel domain-containing protein n=1 Tax=Botryobasidium botryosum (strain FD-172 SS1) TaxID=930990 RepID=A0A067LZK7_BOTB1|nr:hypothetical protein BOTBODRAFT_37576 [Botryobasidium botryosum FD-172 SS1]
MRFATVAAFTTGLFSIALAGPLASRSYTGAATWTNVGLGACGFESHDDELVALVSADVFDNFPGAGANPNANPICNRQITATYGDDTVTVRVVDRSANIGSGDLNLSPAAFQAITAGLDVNGATGLDIGRFQGITWDFV